MIRRSASIRQRAIRDSRTRRIPRGLPPGAAPNFETNRHSSERLDCAREEQAIGNLGLNPWDVNSIETVVAGGDGLQEVVGDKATALK